MNQVLITRRRPWAKQKRKSLRARTEALMSRNPDLPRTDAEWLARTPLEKLALSAVQLLALAILLAAAVVVFAAIASAR